MRGENCEGDLDILADERKSKHTRDGRHPAKVIYSVEGGGHATVKHMGEQNIGLLEAKHWSQWSLPS